MSVLSIYVWNCPIHLEFTPYTAPSRTMSCMLPKLTNLLSRSCWSFAPRRTLYYKHWCHNRFMLSSKFSHLKRLENDHCILEGHSAPPHRCICRKSQHLWPWFILLTTKINSTEIIINGVLISKKSKLKLRASFYCTHQISVISSLYYCFTFSSCNEVQYKKWSIKYI